MATILLTEDDANLAGIFTKWLEADGHTVLTAPDGEAGFDQVIEGRTPDMLVTDLMMPGWDGGDLAYMFGAIGEGRPVLVVTACHDKPRLEKLAVEPYIRAILNKPVTCDQLQSAVREALTG